MKRIKNIIAVLLAAITVIGIVPMSVFAEEEKFELEILPSYEDVNDYFMNIQNGVFSFGSYVGGNEFATIRVIVDGKPVTALNEYKRFELPPNTEYTVKVDTVPGVAATLIGDEECDLTDGEFTTVLNDHSYYTVHFEYTAPEDQTFPDKNPITDRAEMYLSHDKGDQTVTKYVYRAYGKSDTVKGVSYDEETNTLTLNNYINDEDELYLGRMGKGFKINLVGVNRLKSIVGSGFGIRSYYPTGIEFTGNGAIVLNSNSNVYKRSFAGIYVDAAKTESSVKFGKNVKALIYGGNDGTPITVNNRSDDTDGICFDFDTKLSKNITVGKVLDIDSTPVINMETNRKTYKLGEDILLLNVKDTAERFYGPLPDNARFAAYADKMSDNLYKICVLSYSEDYGYFLAQYSDEQGDCYYFDPNSDDSDFALDDTQGVPTDREITLPEDKFTSEIKVINSLDADVIFADKYIDSETDLPVVVDREYDSDGKCTLYIMYVEERDGFNYPLGAPYKKIETYENFSPVPSQYTPVYVDPIYIFNYTGSVLEIGKICGGGHKETVTTNKKATFVKDGKIEKTCKVCNKITYSKTIKGIKSVILSKPSLTYNGKPQAIPKVVVRDMTGKTVSSKNYKVTCKKKIKEIGSYTVTVTFKGDYSGKKDLVLNVNPKSVKLKKVTTYKKGGFSATWNAEKNSSGYQVQYSRSSNFKDAKVASAKDYKTTSKKVKKLKKGKYYVRVRTCKKVGKKTFYSSWSSKKSVKVK